MQNADLKYRWHDRWALLPDSPSGRENGRTHGVAIPRDGDVRIFRQAEPSVLRYGLDGALHSSWGSYLTAHGMTLVVDPDGQEYLWLTDEKSAAVVKTTLDGRVVKQLTNPEAACANGGKYVPTWVAVNEERHGGNGDIWVADGYGTLRQIHRYTRNGEFVTSSNGSENGDVPFSCPHALSFVNRSEPESTSPIARTGACASSTAMANSNAHSARNFCCVLACLRPCRGQATCSSQICSAD